MMKIYRFLMVLGLLVWMAQKRYWVMIKARL